LGEIAKGERLAKMKESERLRLEKAEQEKLERKKLQEEEEEARRAEEPEINENKEGEEPKANGISDHSEESHETTTNGLDVVEDKPTEQAPASTKPTLNPAAPAFQPRFAAPPPPSSLPPTEDIPEDFPKLNGHADASPVEEPPRQPNGTSSSESGDSEQTKTEEGEVNGLGKSWAEVVKTDKEHESAVNGEAAVVTNGEPETREDVAEENKAETVSIPFKRRLL
jgi:hypothetical protein